MGKERPGDGTDPSHARDHLANERTCLAWLRKSAGTYKVVETVPAGVAPEGVAVTEDGKHIYIANSGSARGSVLDTGNNKIVPTSQKVVATVTLGASPYGVAVS
ncbi:DUF202 domain-containing protein (plasmid) [Streptomyces sp. NBC_00984]|uniref:DUF202 domain-containing protein n=1 Tax=Streptomyces sp. NBC_00984 TaxID=2903700 RepID=UPI002F90DEA2|nr:DUF202 domain-containing protein [Streptomyces sp. NBC_00984]